MQMTSVQSSQIAEVGYDEATRTLRIRFHSGGTWSYAGVPAQTHRTLVTTDSVGSFFHRHVRGRYRATKLEDLPERQP